MIKDQLCARIHGEEPSVGSSPPSPHELTHLNSSALKQADISEDMWTPKAGATEVPCNPGVSLYHLHSHRQLA